MNTKLTTLAEALKKYVAAQAAVNANETEETITNGTEAAIDVAAAIDAVLGEETDEVLRRMETVHGSKNWAIVGVVVDGVVFKPSNK